ncbi:MAG: diguanylate cyclase [Burkholderiales bacterium]
MISLGSVIQARLARELNGVIFLSGGLRSYLVGKNGRLDRAEVEGILKALHDEARYIRTFAVAVGTRIVYVYPIGGNEKVIGLNYRDLPAQWPGVRRVIQGGTPVLLGPLDLVQGGRGLIYRMPVRVGGKYWGLVSVVIDSDLLLREALKGVASEDIEIAVRGKDGRGSKGNVFWGSEEVFEDDAEQVGVDVPGGKWIVAMRYNAPGGAESRIGLLLGAIWLLAALLGWGMYAFLVQRARLAHLALFDALTGLPNRTLIEDRMGRAISNQRRESSTVSALLFADLDGFKSINDRFGHRAGDAVLRGVAARTTRAVRDVDSVGRWGGDELIVVLENADRKKIPELIERVRDAIEAPIDYAGRQLAVGASIGTVIVPDDGESAIDLIRLADRRMYEDKQKRQRSGGRKPSAA